MEDGTLSQMFMLISLEKVEMLVALNWSASRLVCENVKIIC